MSRRRRLTLDYHGFRKRIPAPPGSGDTVTVAVMKRFTQDPDDDGLEFGSLTFSAFRDGLYRCAGCLHCDKTALLAQVVWLARVLARARRPARRALDRARRGRGAGKSFRRARRSG